MDLRSYIRDVPDFPEPGVIFRDIAPLMGDADALRQAVEQMYLLYGDEHIQKVIGIESRGFMFGVPIALRLGAGFVPVRKPGKLPGATFSKAYDLEYGSAAVEIHQDALQKDERVLVVDDVLATGGTMNAAVTLAQRLDAHVVGCACLIELLFLQGREKLDGVRMESLLQY